jgi:hypothetical protein
MKLAIVKELGSSLFNNPTDVLRPDITITSNRDRSGDIRDPSCCNNIHFYSSQAEQTMLMEKGGTDSDCIF